MEASEFLGILRMIYIYIKVAIVLFFNLDWQLQVLFGLFALGFFFRFVMDVKQQNATTDFELARASGATPWEASKSAGIWTAGCVPFILVMIICALIVWVLMEFGVGSGNAFEGQ